MTRTYGSYRFAPPQVEERASRGHWELTLEPAAAIRVKRILGRMRASVTGVVSVNHTDEVARDLQWFMERWPLVAADEFSANTLAGAASNHRTLEVRVGEIINDTAPALSMDLAPMKKPRDYQLTAAALVAARRRVLITDEVGLGKTFTAALTLTNPGALPALVVPPTHLPPRWITELSESFPWLSVEVAKTGKVSAAIEAGRYPDVLIVPYSKLAGWADHLAGNIRTVIFDEIQDLRRGVETQKGWGAARLCTAAEYVIGLTATPVYNYGGEIHNILDIMAPGELGTRDEFLREWGGHAMSNGRYSVHDPSGLGSYLRETGLMLGRTRKQVGRELPKTIKVPEEIPSDSAALDGIKGDAAEMARLILSKSGTSQERFRAAGELDWKLREATGIAKAPYVAEFVRLLLESEQRVVLFGWHRAVYDIWNEALAEFNPVMYTGSESPTQKAAAEAAFTAPWDDNRPNTRILIMSLRSGAGIDGLQKVARTAVFGELDWSPQVHEQAIGRLRRDGMGEEPPVAYFLHTLDGSDPILLETLQVKRQQSEPLVNPDGKTSTNATQDTSRARMLAQSVLRLTDAQVAAMEKQRDEDS